MLSLSNQLCSSSHSLGEHPSIHPSVLYSGRNFYQWFTKVNGMTCSQSVRFTMLQVDPDSQALLLPLSPQPISGCIALWSLPYTGRRRAWRGPRPYPTRRACTQHLCRVSCGSFPRWYQWAVDRGGVQPASCCDPGWRRSRPPPSRHLHL